MKLKTIVIGCAVGFGLAGIVSQIIPMNKNNGSSTSNVKDMILLDKSIPEGSWIDGKWATERGADYKPRADILKGRLANGMRYVILKHQNPKGSVSAWLDVQAGSLVERPNERGLMHLLEHMAFNGTKNFPAGSLIGFFQENGMTFGGDSNAFTSRTTTAYQLKLKSDKIDKGLDILSDFSGRALLSQKEIDSERQVVLHEKTLRDTPMFRLIQAYTNHIYGGTKYTEMPIGSKDVVLHATKKTLTDLYHAWYRPKNEIILVVGDIDPQAVKKQIEEKFSDLKAVGKPRTLPYWGDLKTKGLHTLYYKDKTTAPRLIVSTLRSRRFLNDTYNNKKDTILNSVAGYIYQMRIQQQIEEKKSPYLNLNYDVTPQFTPTTELVATVNTTANWKDILAYTHKNLEQALEYGFTQAEFDSAKKAFTLQVNDAVQKEKTTSNEMLISQFLTSLNTNLVPKDPQQIKDIFVKVFKESTLDDLNKTFKKAWNTNNRYVVYTGNINVQGGNKAISDEWTKLQKVKVEKPLVEQTDNKFPYLETPKAVEIKSTVDKTGFNEKYNYKDVTFNNGTVAHFKATQNKKDQIIVALKIGKGLSQYKGADYYKAQIATHVYNSSGIGKFSPTKINQNFSGNEFSISSSIENNGLNIVMVTRKKDLKLAFQMLYTKIKDPKLMESVFDKYQTSLKQDLPLMDTRLDSSQAYKSFKFVNGPDIPKPLTYNESKNIKFAGLEQLMKNTIKGSTSITVVGDFEQKEISDLLAQYVVSIPEINKNPQDKFKTSYPKYVLTKGKTLNISSQDPSNKANVTVYIPIPGQENNNLRTDSSYSERDKQMAFATYFSSILNDRLRAEIRERLQLSYSPYALTHASYNQPNYGYIALVISTRIAEVNNVKKALLSILDDIKKNGVTEKEVALFKHPIQVSHSLIYQNNMYWLAVLQSIDYRKFNALYSAEKVHNTVMNATADDMNKLAKSLLVKKNISFVVTKGKGVKKK